MNDRKLLILGTSPALIFLGYSFDASMLSAENSVIREMSSVSFLGYLGVILTLSIGLLVQLFFMVEKLSAHLDRSVIREIRMEIKSTAKYLVWIFAFSTAIVIVKGMLPLNEVFWSFLSGVQIWLVIFYLLILYDVVMSAFEFDV